MKRRTYRQQGPGALDLIEEAVHMLRLAPPAVLASYYLGALPFVLGGLYFWADMARSATAHHRCAPAAFGMALLFVWMKTWQVVFAAELKALVSGRDSAPTGLTGWLRAGWIQMILQPWKLLLLPVALLLVVPFGWAFAFFENTTVFAGRAGADANQVFRASLRQARVWPWQNHHLLAVLGLFGFVVFLDTCIGLITLPALLRMMLGVESALTRGGWSVLNTTFIALCGGVAFLCLDPLVKAIYVLRCFYGEALETGEDLRAAFRGRTAQDVAAPRPGGRAGALPRGASNPSLRTITVLLALLAAAPMVPPVLSEEPAAPTAGAHPSPPGLSPTELDRAIQEVLSRREYEWRSPRERVAEEDAQKGVLSAFLDGLLDTLRSWGRTLVKWLKTAAEKTSDFLDWIRQKLGGRRGDAPSDGGPGFGWIASLHFVLWGLVALLVCTAAILVWRSWRPRHRRAEAISEPLSAVPDLTDEAVTAAELPEDEWLKLAGEWIGRGDLRLGLRALYLASLAHLARRELIRIARFKSNQDYERELRRRTRSLPDLPAMFSENVSVFERAWYGLHEVTQDGLRRFQSNLEKIKAC
jgi:hypothetical protein